MCVNLREEYKDKCYESAGFARVFFLSPHLRTIHREWKTGSKLRILLPVVWMKRMVFYAAEFWSWRKKFQNCFAVVIKLNLSPIVFKAVAFYQFSRSDCVLICLSHSATCLYYYCNKYFMLRVSLNVQ